MDREQVIRALKYTANKYKDKFVGTGETDIVLMCNEVIRTIEELIDENEQYKTRLLTRLEKLKQIELDREDSCDEDGYGDGVQIHEDGVSSGKYQAYVTLINTIKNGDL